MDIRLDRQRAFEGAATTRACLVRGCTCKDPRIISTRRVAFFASWAKSHGETADRSIPPDPDWRFSFVPTRTF